MKCNFPTEAAVLAEYTDYGRPMKPFLTISQTFGQIDRINFGVFGVFSAELLSAPILALWVPCSWFLSFSCFFHKKTLLFRPNQNISQIWYVLAKENLGNSHQESVVGGWVDDTISSWNGLLHCGYRVWILSRKLKKISNGTWKAERKISREIKKRKPICRLSWA